MTLEEAVRDLASALFEPELLYPTIDPARNTKSMIRLANQNANMSGKDVTYCLVQIIGGPSRVGYDQTTVDFVPVDDEIEMTAHGIRRVTVQFTVYGPDAGEKVEAMLGELFLERLHTRAKNDNLHLIDTSPVLDVPDENDSRFIAGKTFDASFYRYTEAKQREVYIGTVDPIPVTVTGG